MSPRPTAPRPPLWARHPALVVRVTLAVIAAAAIGGLLAELLAGEGWRAVPAPVLAAGAGVVGLRYPRVGLLGLAAAPLVGTALGHLPLLAWTLTVFAGFLLCFRGLHGLPAGALLGTSNYAAMAILLPGGFIDPTALVAASMTLVATAVGSAARSQLRYFESIEQRARDALATRDAEATRRVAEERLRIARDLHDVVGHEVAILGMHLGVAEVSIDAENAAARQALTEARTRVQSVLRETQNILSLLRPAADEARRPSPEAAEIDELIRDMRAAGMSVEAEIPDLGEVPAGIGLAVYRIAQEALTNAQRHGNGRVRVAVSLAAQGLTLEVSNPAPERDDGGEGGGGYGLVGMRERAVAAGGRLVIERRPGEFIVRAELPLAGGG